MKGPRWLITEYDRQANRVLIAKLVCRENSKAALWQGKHTVFISDCVHDCHDLDFHHDGDLESVREAVSKAYGAVLPEPKYNPRDKTMVFSLDINGDPCFAYAMTRQQLDTPPHPEVAYRWVVLLRYTTLEGALRAGERLMGLPETRILPHGRGWKEEV